MLIPVMNMSMYEIKKLLKDKNLHPNNEKVLLDELKYREENEKIHNRS